MVSITSDARQSYDVNSNPEYKYVLDQSKLAQLRPEDIPYDSTYLEEPQEDNRQHVWGIDKCHKRQCPIEKYHDDEEEGIPDEKFPDEKYQKLFADFSRKDRNYTTEHLWNKLIPEIYNELLTLLDIAVRDLRSLKNSTTEEEAFETVCFISNQGCEG